MPTASKTWAILSCPSAIALERDVQNFPLPPSEAMERGTDIHAHLESLSDDAIENAPAELQPLLKRAQSHVLGLSKEVFGSSASEADTRVEVRMFSKTPGGREFSGKPDLYMRVGKVGLIVDWKTGDPTGTAMTAAQAQVEALAALAHEQDKLERCMCSVYWVEHDKSLRVSLDARQMSQTLRKIWDAIDVASPGVFRTGEWCSYCSARHVCPAQSDWALMVREVNEGKLTRAELAVRVLKAAKVMDKLADAAKAYLRKCPPEALEALGVRQVQVNRLDVADGRQNEAFLKLSGLVGSDIVLGNASFSLAGIAKALAKHENLTEQEAREEIRRALGDAAVERVSWQLRV